ncbi:hypothetical protein BV898_15857 [Hypsibius exemplaris]|uniref:Receptor ligand binding region domain-containing protein n=1 Tax=Hypsibius exemplaris TaxID=2072580 RepID=A0A9X6NC59_HYPEX|nr:hypothetical protein BV898_15857 [Hypsibius exemplaris]
MVRVLAKVVALFCACSGSLLFAMGEAPSRRVHIVSPGFFSWNIEPSLSHFAPAVDTGLAEVRRKYPHFNWTSEFLLRDTMRNCSNLRDNIQYELAKWYYTRSYSADDALTVIIAPGCSEARPLSQLAAGWDILLITSVDYTENMADRSEFPTYVTTSPLTPVNAVIFCALFTEMNWTRLYLLHDTGSSPYYGLQASFLPLRIPTNCRVQLTRQQFHSGVKNVSQQLQPILRDFNSKSRVMLYLGNAIGLRDILIEAVKMNMTSGEHVFLTVTTDDSADWLFSWQTMSSDDELIRGAYRAVMLIKLTDTAAISTPSWRGLISQWRTLAEDKYNNTKLQYHLAPQILMAGHIAFELMAEAVHAASQDGWSHPPPSGKLLAEQLLNHTFDLAIGKVHVLGRGQMAVRHVTTCFDLLKGSFMTCFVSNNDALTERFLWDRDANGTWFGGQSFPPDEPQCGFNGQRNTPECASKSSLRDRWLFGVGTAFGVWIVGLAGAFTLNMRSSPEWILKADLLVFPNVLVRRQRSCMRHFACLAFAFSNSIAAQ